MTIFFILFQLITIVPLYYLVKRKIASQPNSNFRVLLTTLALSIILFFLFYSINNEVIKPLWRSKEFSKNEWSDNRESRYRMINDLIANNKLGGKSRSQVIDMLGPDFRLCIPNAICYWAQDPDVFLLLDDFMLIITFDKNEMVKKVEYFPI